MWPDLTFYLQIPATLAVQRQRAQQLPLDRIEGSPEDFHSAVSRAFEEQAASAGDRVVRVDATRPAMAVSRDIEETVRGRLPSVSGIPAARAAARA